MRNQTIVILANGVTVKGSYTMTMTGTHFDLYVMNASGALLASRNFGQPRCFDAAPILVALVAGLASFLDRHRLGTIVSPRILAIAVPLMVKAFRKDIALKQAA